jgi:hypothetical protein
MPFRVPQERVHLVFGEYPVSDIGAFNEGLFYGLKRAVGVRSDLAVQESRVDHRLDLAKVLVDRAGLQSLLLQLRLKVF